MLRLQGTVAHSQWRDGYCMGASVRLEDVDPDVEDQIQEIITRHLERSHMPMVVVLDTGRLERLGIQRFLATLDRDVVFAHSSLDALWLLERFRANYGTILVDQSFIEENGAGILLFLHDQYLDKRRVLVVPRFETIQADLSTTVWAVHGVLTTPWTRAQVEAALGLFPAQRSERPKRILFVDDEPAVLSGLQHRLRKYLPQYETVWVTSGEVAVSESKARPFDVVVTDLRMPGMDGIALLRAIKAQSPRSKRVVLSGLDTHAAKEVADVVLHKSCLVDSLRLEVFGAA
jgi:CheY-like chemotaxis protein